MIQDGLVEDVVRAHPRRVLTRLNIWLARVSMVIAVVAVAVRDAGHIGMDSIIVLLPLPVQRWLEMLIHILVGGFGVAMACNGWVLGMSVAHFLIPNLGLPEIVRYVPLALSGAMIVLFSVEHLLALLRREEVEPTWN